MLGEGGKSCRQIRAHRYSWELHNGPIPEGLVVCHRCDTPLCVRPDHLFLGTPAENNWDKVAKGRQTRGAVLISAAKLSEEQVIEIRDRYASGEVSQTSLAAEYGVNQSTISETVRNLHWRHVGAAREG